MGGGGVAQCRVVVVWHSVGWWWCGTVYSVVVVVWHSVGWWWCGTVLGGGGVAQCSGGGTVVVAVWHSVVGGGVAQCSWWRCGTV